MNIHDYPTILKAVAIIAHDTGAVHRDQPEDHILNVTQMVMSADGVTTDDVEDLEAWLADLTEEQLVVACIGEHSEMMEVTATAPVGGPDETPLTALLEDIWVNM